MANNDLALSLILTKSFSGKPDVINWAETVGAGASSSKNLTNAINGTAQAAELVNSVFLIRKIHLWSQFSIIDITIQPDSASEYKLVTQAYTTKHEIDLFPFIPITNGIDITITNNQQISDDAFITAEIIKLTESNYDRLMSLVNENSIQNDNCCVFTNNLQINTNQKLDTLLTIQNKLLSIEQQPILLPEETKLKGVTDTCKRI